MVGGETCHQARRRRYVILRHFHPNDQRARIEKTPRDRFAKNMRTMAACGASS